MARGGRRENAGRKKGVPNTKTQEQIKAVVESGITPLEYMLGLLRDEMQDPERRLDAAKAAAPYVHAKLSSVELGNLRADDPLKIVVTYHKPNGD